VDLCWRLQGCGRKLGFSPAAVVWHHRRNSISGYWKQQRGYGRSEALLEKKWPEKYNAAGHVSWAGRVYGNGFFTVFPHAGRIYQGPWGTAPYQRLYQAVPGTLSALVLTPEWYLIVGLLSLLAVLGVSWRPLLFSIPLWLVSLGTPLAHAVASGWCVPLTAGSRGRLELLRLRFVIAQLYVLQPVARLLGRVYWGLTPWRYFRATVPRLPRPRTVSLWSEHWRSVQDRLSDIESRLREPGAVVCRGGDFDRWDLQVRGGLLGSARLLMAVEEHGQGRQQIRLRVWARYSQIALALVIGLTGLCVGAGVAGAWLACGIMGGMAAVLASGAMQECCNAISVFCNVIHKSAALEPAARPTRVVAIPRPKVNPSPALSFDMKIVTALPNGSARTLEE